MISENKINGTIAFIVLVLSFLTFISTVANVVPYWDCGEFIACSYTLSVPHPPGSPLFILLGKAFTFIMAFIEDKAMRVNMMSPVFSALSTMFLYLIIVRMIRFWRGEPKNLEDRLIAYGSAFVGAMAFNFTDSFWFNAVEAEVYAASTFFTAIIVWLILIWNDKAEDPESEKYILLIAYIVGLATGVHLLNVLALPTIFLIIYYREVKEQNIGTFIKFSIVSFIGLLSIYPGIVMGIPQIIDKFSFLALILAVGVIVWIIYYAITNSRTVMALVAMSALLIFIGYSTYSLIYIRSTMQPTINENDPSTPERLVKYLNREQYGTENQFTTIFQRKAPFWDYQVNKMYIRYFLWQFVGRGPNESDSKWILPFSSSISEDGVDFSKFFALPLIIGLLGAFHHFSKDKKRAFATFVLFFMTGLAIVLYLNQPDPQPRERDYSYVGSFFAFAIWIGIGISAILEWISEILKEKESLKRPLLISVLIVAAGLMPVNILLANYHEHDRRNNYVAWDYSYNILVSCEPNGIIFTNGDNDTFPLWYLQEVEGIRKDVRVVNLSLLNTDWYIYQLKHFEPKVPMSLNDAQIARVQPIPWEKRTLEIKVPKEVVQLEIMEFPESERAVIKIQDTTMRFELAPTLSDVGIRVQDYMVYDIIVSNKWKKPIYFAVTVSNSNMIGLQNKYLRMDGLAFKVVPFQGQTISASKLHQNLFEKFKYRHLGDPSVFYDSNIQNLLQNYRSAFLRLADNYSQYGTKEQVAQVIDKMEESVPSSTIPMRDAYFNIFIGKLYQEAGQTEKAKKYLDIASSYKMDADDKLNLGWMYMEFMKDYKMSEKIFKDILLNDPDNIKAVSALVRVYERTENYQEGANLMQDWLTRHPGDETALEKLNEFRAKLSAGSTSEDGK